MFYLTLRGGRDQSVRFTAGVSEPGGASALSPVLVMRCSQALGVRAVRLSGGDWAQFLPRAQLGQDEHGFLKVNPGALPLSALGEAGKPGCVPTGPGPDPSAVMQFFSSFFVVVFSFMGKADLQRTIFHPLVHASDVHCGQN